MHAPGDDDASDDPAASNYSVRELSLRVEPGESVALLGPSGCGKTTLLRLIAGLERPLAGTVQLGERFVAGPPGRGGTWVAPEARRVGMVFQDWALFGHLTVGRNVGYGLERSQRTPRRIAEALDLVGLGGFEDRLPSTLSGGQQQRVALARALAPHPGVLLLDEPFSHLDASLREEVRSEVRRLLIELGITAVFVTHDQDEAFVVGDRVGVLRDGPPHASRHARRAVSPAGRPVRRRLRGHRFVAALRGHRRRRAHSARPPSRSATPPARTAMEQHRTPWGELST